MRKLLSLILAALMMFSFTACQAASLEIQTSAESNAATEAAQTKAATEAVAETTAEATTAALPNPMEEVSGADEFVKKLGIQLNTTFLNSEAKFFIIDGRIAECQFSYDNIRGNRVDCTLRATKDAEAAKNLSGIYDSTLKSITDFELPGKDSTFKINLSSNDADDVNIYTWKAGDVWYSYSIVGKTTGMELAEMLYSAVSVAVGKIEAFSKEMDAIFWYELNDDETQLTVRLRANATTGYQWSAKIWDPTSLEQVKAEYIPDETSGNMTGAGGVWEAVYKVPAGIDTNGVYGRSNYITFTYAREWEKEKIPSKALDILIHEQTMEIMNVHEPDLTTKMADDGEYDVTLAYTDMLEESALSFYALVGLPKVITFTEAEVKAMKAGDVIDLEKYGLYNITVDHIKKLDDSSIEITDSERFEFNKDLNSWVIRGWDDDIYQYNTEMRQVHFTNETLIDDGMEDVLRTGNSGTIYDKMRSYQNIDATVIVIDGFVSRIRIYYHP